MLCSSVHPLVLKDLYFIISISIYISLFLHFVFGIWYLWYQPCRIFFNIHEHSQSIVTSSLRHRSVCSSSRCCRGVWLCRLASVFAGIRNLRAFSKNSLCIMNRFPDPYQKRSSYHENLTRTFRFFHYHRLRMESSTLR